MLRQPFRSVFLCTHSIPTPQSQPDPNACFSAHSSLSLALSYTREGPWDDAALSSLSLFRPRPTRHTYNLEPKNEHPSSPRHYQSTRIYLYMLILVTQAIQSRKKLLIRTAGRPIPEHLTSRETQFAPVRTVPTTHAPISHKLKKCVPLTNVEWPVLVQAVRQLELVIR